MESMLRYELDNVGDRLIVFYSKFEQGETEWLGFVISKTAPVVIALVIEAVEDDDRQEVMQLWDGAVVNY